MLRHAFRLLLMGCAIGYLNVAQADWGVSGAQYLCDGKANAFELLPYDRSSDDPPEGLPLEPGFKEIPERAPPFVCKLGRFTLHVVIEVYPPASHGEGMGAGFVRARSIGVSGIELLPDSPEFDWSIDPGKPPLTRIRVSARRTSVTIDRCYTAQATSAPARETCESRDVPVVSLAAARAEARRPADMPTQVAQSATTLPPRNDLANAFVTSDPRGAPLCAHLSTVFLGGIGRDFGTPAAQARIAGRPGARIYIRPVNPQVCDASKESLCKATSYLIPGDRVDMGFVCGAWSYVSYEPASKATLPIAGWVATNELYAVDPLEVTAPQKEIAKWHGVTDDPLIHAVVANDVGRVRALLAAGANPEGLPQKYPGQYTPLSLAVGMDADSMVEVLLTARADVRNPAVVESALTTSRPIWDALIQHGMDVKVGKDPLGRLAELDRIGMLGIEMMRGRWRPVRDLPALIRRLLDAGVPVDQPDEREGTALIRTFRNNNVDAAKALLSAGANPNTEFRGLSTLMNAMQGYSLHHDPTMVTLLLEAGAAVNARSAGTYMPDAEELPGNCCPKAGQTALTLAAGNGQLTLTRLLLEHGADPAIPRSDGSLPMTLAREGNHPDVAALIESYAKKGTSNLQSLP